MPTATQAVATSADLLNAMPALLALHPQGISSGQIAQATGVSTATVKRHLERLCSLGQVVRTGQSRATRYRLPEASALTPTATQTSTSPSAADTAHPAWSTAAEQLRRRLSRPLAARAHVTYQRSLVEDYVPNHSALLPPSLAQTLANQGRLQGQQPAGTYARKVLEQLLIDLSWSSSRLEGNTYTRLATEELFKQGLSGTDTEAVMLLNHKNAIEFMVDAVPEQGLTLSVVRNLHALLMQDLLADSQSLGSIRQKVVNISGTVYLPTQVPSLLSEMLNLVIDKARLINNPVEAAFFLWVHLAYLQPFEDGNKRTSRLSANIPLMLYNCAPLSFMDVSQHDYAQAMLGVYELRDMALAVDLFSWTYQRSCQKYAVVLESMGIPNPLRLQHREHLNEAMALVVRERQPLNAALQTLGLTPQQAPGFAELLRDELHTLEAFNCARYRLTVRTTTEWIAAGRPQ